MPESSSFQDANLQDNGEGQDKHHADRANLGEEDMKALLEDPDTGPGGLGLAEEDTDCARLLPEVSEGIVARNIRSGWGHPEGGIEDVEIP